MADKKITELTELTIPADEDLLAIVDDPSGTPETKKITRENLLGSAPIKTDTISEKTANAGVIIDSFKIKDGRVVAWDGWMPAEETWTYSSWDSTVYTGVITVPSGAAGKYSVGMRIKISQSTGGTKYGIITKVADTALTVFFGTDYTLNNEAISSPYYSTQKAPFGFPLNPTGWAVTLNVTTSAIKSSPATGVWYNVGSLNITFPIGLWRVWYSAFIAFLAENVTLGSVLITLSTANDSESDPYFTVEIAYRQASSGVCNMFGSVSKEKILLLSSKTTYYINIKTYDPSLSSIRLFCPPPATFQAVCAYL